MKWGTLRSPLYPEKTNNKRLEGGATGKRKGGTLW